MVIWVALLVFVTITQIGNFDKNFVTLFDHVSPLP